MPQCYGPNTCRSLGEACEFCPYGDVVHVWNWNRRPRPRTTAFGYELDTVERILILLMIGRGVRKDGVIRIETWKIIAENLAREAHVTRMMTVREACKTWWACRAVCTEFQQAAHLIWKEVCRCFAVQRIKRLIFFSSDELDDYVDAQPPGTSWDGHSGEVLHVFNWGPAARPHTSFAYELEYVERIYILLMMGRGVRQDGVIEDETWKIIAHNLASGAHVTRIMTFHEARATWLEFQLAAHLIRKEVGRCFAEHRTRRLLFFRSDELDCAALRRWRVRSSPTFAAAVARVGRRRRTGEEQPDENSPPLYRLAAHGLLPSSIVAGSSSGEEPS